jgi:hypothetical protein
VEGISVEFRWERSEYLRATRKVNFSRPFRTFLVSAFSMLLSGSVLLALGSDSVAVFFLGLGVVYVVLAVWMRESVPKRAWRTAIGVQDPIRLTINEEGITATSSESESKVSWRHYPYSKEWPDYYVLRRTRRSVARIIPKRGIKSPRDEKVLRAILTSHTEAALSPSIELDGF